MVTTRSGRSTMPISSSPFPLLELPPELRNIIYRSALIADEGIDIIKPRHGLIEACQQTRNECAGLFFFENTFVCAMQSGGAAALKPIKHWLSRIGRENRQNLRNLRCVITISVDAAPTAVKEFLEAMNNLQRTLKNGCHSDLVCEVRFEGLDAFQHRIWQDMISRAARGLTGREVADLKRAYDALVNDVRPRVAQFGRIALHRLALGGPESRRWVNEQQVLYYAIITGGFMMIAMRMYAKEMLNAARAP